MEEIVIITSSSSDAGVSCWNWHRSRGSDDSFSRCFSYACPPHGLAWLGAHSLAASQIQRAGSVGSGEIFFWTLTKHVQAERRYPFEPIVPLASTRSGSYIAGGGSSGKIYLWEVSSWSLLCSWAAHHQGVSCLVFSEDDSLLISGSDDGTVIVWLLIRIMDKSKGSQAIAPATSRLFLYKWSGHRAPVTAVILSAGGANAVVVSSSLDQTCKVWALGTGKLLQSLRLQSGITSLALHQASSHLYAGTMAGKINICSLGYWHHQTPTTQHMAKGSEIAAHSLPVTALAMGGDGASFISGSDDKLVRVWDVRTEGLVKECQIKGPVTNLLLISESEASMYQKGRGLHIGSAPKGFDVESSVPEDPVVHICTGAQSYRQDDEGHVHSACCLEDQLLQLKHDSTTAALEMKIAMLKEKVAQAWMLQKEYSKQTELLRALYSTEIQYSLTEKGLE